MTLSEIDIENFRSIENQTVSFDLPFKILVGKNESGKSNILKALSYLDSDKEVDINDIRQSLDVEDNDPVSSITFVFTLNEDEVQTVYEKVKAVFHDFLNIEDVAIAKDQKKNYSLRQLCQLFNSAVYWIDLNKKKKYHSYRFFKDQVEIIPSIGLYYNSKPDSLSQLDFLKYNFAIPTILEERNMLVVASAEHIYDTICGFASDIVKEKHPSVINWEYKESDILSERIDIDSFLADPNKFKPLKTMFELAGIEKIIESLSGRKASGDYHKLNNFLKQIAAKTTAHFRLVWKEYDDVEFTLNADGNSIITGIKEENTFTFTQRSDGFKRFVTFLLMISASYATEGLKETLLLIDEPDVTLHPSGIKFLRDELIKISSGNYIVASTHSIFLIDSSKIERHYIVTKEKEVTNITTANDENLISEEVLYRALGFSFFEILKPQNLVFEGWKDKKLFKTALERVPAEFKDIKELKEFGIAQIGGVKEARSASALMELANRKLYIISDSDEPAIQHQRNFSKDHCYGTWITYRDVDKTFDNCTGEDFLKEEYVINAFNEFKKNNPELSDGHLNLTNDSFVKAISKTIRGQVTDTDASKELILKFKDYLFEDLRQSNINIKYYSFLQKMSELLKKIS